MILDKLQNQSLEQQRLVLSQFVRQHLADFLMFESADEIAPDARFADLGTSSAEAVGFKIQLENLLQCALRTTLLFDHPSVDALVDYLLKDVLKIAALNTPQETVNNNKNNHTSPSVSHAGIAVIGYECVFPGIGNKEDYWEAITGARHLAPTDSNQFNFGKLSQFPDLESTAILGIDAKTLSSASLALKWLYATLAKAVELHHISFEEIRQDKIGVFIAGSSEQGISKNDPLPFSLPLANDLSYRLNLKGPSETFNVFCTSVYMAIQHAMDALKQGYCDTAIVGGINLINEKEFHHNATKGLYDNLLSKDNKTYSFSIKAEGFHRAEGAGILVLTTVEKAISERYTIEALIHNVQVQHGGRAYAPEAPNASGIKATIYKSLSQSGIESSAIDYIEAHGIGNVISDAIELNALSEAYTEQSGDSAKQWHISTVKPLLGHPEVASGMASIIKAILSVQKGILPPVLNFEQPNEELSGNKALLINALPLRWKKPVAQRYAGLSSYGIGGLNAHLVLSGYEAGIIKLPVESKKQQHNFTEHRTSPEVSPTIMMAIDALMKEVADKPLDEIDSDLSPVHYGFDSIKIVQLIRRLNDRLNINLKLGQLLSAGSFKEFFLDVEKTFQQTHQEYRNSAQHTDTIDLEYLPLSEVQKGLWYIQQSDLASTAFNVPILFKSKTALDKNYLTQAFLYSLELFPILRTRIIQDKEGTLRHQVDPVFSLDKDMLQTVAISKDGNIEQQLWQLLRIPFDFLNKLCPRFYILEQSGNEESYIAFIFHHILIDGISGVDFTNTFWNAYYRLSANETLPYQLPDTRFFDFVQREQNYLKSSDATQDVEWWQSQLQDISFEPLLPYDTLPDAVLKPKTVKVQSFTCTEAEFSLLKSLAQKSGATLSVVLMALFKVLLYKLSNVRDIILTTPIEGRPTHSDEHAMGCYINLMLTRSELSGELSFADLVQHIRQSMAAGMDHSSLPFPKLSAALGLQSTARILNPLPVSFTYQNIFDAYHFHTDIQSHIEPVYSVYQETDDHYTFEVYDWRDSLQINIKYQTVLFEDDTIQQHILYFRNLLQSVEANSGARLEALQILDEQQQSELLNLGGSNACALSEDNVCTLIAHQAQCTPNLLALVFRSEQLTYREMLQRATAIAVHLRDKGLKDNAVVAFSVPRSIDMVVTALGILFAGATYVYLDKAYPPERNRYIIQDAAPQFLLVQDETIISSQTSLDIAVIDIDKIVADKETKNKLPQISAGNNAYIVYTSGSTGTPKGVLIGHQALLNLCCCMQQRYDITASDTVLNFASMSFDMSVEEIFPYLTTGAKVVIRTEEDLVPDHFYNTIVAQDVTILNLPPQFFNVLQVLKKDKLDTMFSQIRLVAFGGEALPESILKTVQQYPLRIFNAYGPSEYTVNACIGELTQSPIVHIGTPVCNTQMLILDKDKNLVPKGITGELYLCGVGMAKGYINQPVQDAAFFINNPYGTGKLYKTGDRVRWNDKLKVLQYLGRADNQIKIRGYRVEPDEVATCMKKWVEEAIVLTRERSGNYQLIAFYTSDQEWNNSEWNTMLSQWLPDYMIPIAFIKMKQWPVNANGKIDAKKLLQQAASHQIKKSTTVQIAETPMQKQIVGIWEAVLERSPVGINQGFYELGGHSLQAIQIVLRINQQLGSNLTLSDFFKHKNIQHLGDLLEQNTPAVLQDTLCDFSKAEDEFII